MMENIELIQKAASVIATRKVGDRLFGDVGAALVTDKGNVYTRICIDTSGIGFCAEQSAIAAMMTAGETKVEKIVATWKDENGDVFVISPCGHCREFMHQTNDGKMDIKVILSKEKTAMLSELLPHRDSWERV
jgi:cytidine deaminase